MYQLTNYTSHFGIQKKVCRTFETLEIAKEILCRQPFNIVIFDEDEDGFYNLMDKNGKTYQLERIENE